MKKEKNKKIFAIILLITLTCFSFFLTYLKFFSKYATKDNNIKEVPVNNSSSIAIHEALKTITNNFNESTSVKNYENKNNVKLNAKVNNYSIFISYTNDTTITYEFLYDNLNLSINVLNDNQENFHIVYKFLIEAVQKRINNTENTSEIVDDFLQNGTNYEGLSKETNGKITKYQLNITQKLKQAQ